MYAFPRKPDLAKQLVDERRLRAIAQSRRYDLFGEVAVARLIRPTSAPPSPEPPLPENPGRPSTCTILMPSICSIGLDAFADDRRQVLDQLVGAVRSCGWHPSAGSRRR
ncbi:MAG: hypothetical protein QM744_00715 [Mesorhizobium sp.]